MSPRKIRDYIRSGDIIKDGTVPVEPPREWPNWKRKRLEVAIQCAMLFLVEDLRWHQILSRLKHPGSFQKKKLTKSRVQQYIDRGSQFLLKIGALKVKRKRGSKCP